MVGSGRKIDGGKNRAGKGREHFTLPPQSPPVFPFVFLFALAAYDLTCPHHLNAWNRLKKPILNQQAKYVKLSLFM